MFPKWKANGVRTALGTVLIIQNDVRPKAVRCEIVQSTDISVAPQRIITESSLLSRQYYNQYPFWEERHFEYFSSQNGLHFICLPYPESFYSECFCAQNGKV